MATVLLENYCANVYDLVMKTSDDQPRASSDGWVAFAGPPLGFGAPVMCRVAEIGGRHRIIELRLAGGPIDGAALRGLPISAMEQLIASAIRATVLNAADPSRDFMWSDANDPDLLKQLGRPGTEQAEQAQRRLIIMDRHADYRTWVIEKDPTLEWRRGMAITDDFLRDVGAAYDAAIQRGEAPAKTIAASIGASQKTVQSWIYQGRLKGVIAPAQRKGRIQ